MAAVTCAIVGAGPAGSHLATQLAQHGVHVLLFDSRAPWDKPCGAAITGKVLTAIPRLKDFSGFFPVKNFHFFSPSGEECRIHCPEGFYTFSRKELNGFLLEDAKQAGVSFYQKKVTQVRWRGGQEVWELHTEDGEQYLAYHLVGADGANSVVAQFLDLPKPLETPLTLGVGYHYPYDFEGVATIKFLDDLPGFLWVLPRDGFSNIGIVATAAFIHGQRLYERLDQFVTRFYEIEIPDKIQRFVGSIPWYEPFRTERIMGLRWTMVGDAAGWVDPISKEGLYYSLVSADLLGDALGRSLPDGDYRTVWRESLNGLLKQLRRGRRWYKRFYHPPRVNKMIRRTRKYGTYQRLMSDFLAGKQTYKWLRLRLLGCWLKSIFSTK